ncbi:hypothetical protein [Polaribacter gangjinensis]|uniref:Uncharacterized protein n=1 Tax=Polaribacter gangjinensis TaxID=574710 RepID=A0A2S7WDP1_9FLAO|nr:hypothetical protein [Polaribacter gangjinensis]PQJ75401.1 hypothetical protein BTO13_09185 [Polaribacter gangjinensis]
MNFLKKLFEKRVSDVKIEASETTYKPMVVMGHDNHPTLLLENDLILPREIEMIENLKYYPNGKIGEWLCDPISGEKLPFAYEHNYSQQAKS